MGDAYMWFEIISMVIMVGILLADVFIVSRNPHIPTAKESALWVGFYAGLAVAFGILLGIFVDGHKATEFFAGWLTEYSLSIDNLFVFIIIMTRFAVPKKLQQEVLMVGVVLALVLRGLFILIGSALIEQFSWIFYIFGAFLLYTAYHQAFRGQEEDEETESKLIVWLRRRISVSKDFDGIKIRTVVEGKKSFTPMIVVFLAIAATDVMFAFDSIPAIFGITTDAFIVFAANVFALMGLRQLYFLLGNLMDKLEFLKYGIAFILAFIGFNLVSHAMHVNELPFINGGQHIEWAPDVPTSISLMVIVAAISVSAVASIAVARRRNKHSA